MPRQQFVITTPIPTVEETAERLGVPPHRLKRIIELADELAAGVKGARNRQPAAKRKSASPKRAPRTRAK